jgi:hypothetical protein
LDDEASKSTDRWKSVVAWRALCIIWSSTWIAIKIGLTRNDSFGPGHLDPQDPNTPDFAPTNTTTLLTHSLDNRYKYRILRPVGFYPDQGILNLPPNKPLMHL